MKSKPFDFEQAAKLENYVRKRYRKQLSKGALSFYLCAFQTLERAEFGLCNSITKGHRELAEAGVVSKDSVKKYLSELDGLLCEIVPGSSIKFEKKATQIRRYNLHELRNGEPKRKLIDYAPADARELAELLYSRTFVYGDNPTCRPSWNVSRTGRIQSSKQNVQGHSEKKRIKNLCAGLQPGQVLIYADYKAAEPTIIQNVMGYRFDSDPYQKAADLLGIDRDSAKDKVSKLAYFWDSKVCLSFWKCPPAEKEFMPYAEALNAYKEKLRTIGKPRNKKRRYVHTLTGRKIEAGKGESAHRGQILSWQIQGTVADILNAVCLEIIEQESSKHWKFCFPEHDAVYVIGTPEQADEIGRIMENEAARSNQPLSVKIETFGAGDVV